MKIFLAIGALILCAVSSSAWAGAWLQPEGKGLFITQASYFTNNEFYNRNGDTVSQARYRKYELQPYAEYGLTDRLTIGGTAYLQSASQSGRDNYGVADPEIFLRTTLWKGENQLLSLQPLVKFKSEFAHDISPRGGSSSTDGELSLLYGRNLNLLSPRDYLDVRVGYRYRANSLNDQVRADAALGLNLSEHWQLTPAIRSIHATRIDRNAVFSENGDQDYDLLKVELGAAYKLSETRAVGVTVFDHIDGRQTGNGGGLTFSFAQRF